MTATQSTLHARLLQGDLVLLDGAVGTDLERIGVPMVENAWCGVSALTHPDECRRVHLSHIDAGAEIVIANTYASSRHLLRRAGYEDDFEQINRRAVELALEARNESGKPGLVVAGSMSTTRQGGPFPSIEEARINFAEQARILADAGAELIVLEMMRDIDHTRACLDGAFATGLPVWLGLSAVVKDGVAWMWEESVTVEDFMLAFAHDPVEAMVVMHTETDDIDACLDVVQRHWQGPVGVYAQSGRFDPPKWVFIDVISAPDYAAACMRWIDRGVQIVGGCCGIGHEHIAHLRPLVEARRSG